MFRGRTAVKILRVALAMALFMAVGCSQEAPTGPVAKKQVAVDDPDAMAEQIKNKARRFGAGVVGITEFTETDWSGGPMCAAGPGPPGASGALPADAR